MLLKDRVNDLLNRVNQLRSDEELREQTKLPENCWFLSDDEVVCFERTHGDSRYPYDQGGMSLWAHSGGGLRIFEGSLNIVLDSFLPNSVPNLCFYAGKKRENGYFPVSLTGAGKVPAEERIERFTVFSPEAVYYFTITEGWKSCVRMFVDEEKNLQFSVCLMNGAQETQTYVSSYFNPYLRHGKFENYGTKRTKACHYTKEHGFVFRVVEGIFRSECNIYYACMAVGEKEKKVLFTTSYIDFAGSMHNLVNCATSLQNGYYEEGKAYTEFVENAIAATMIPLTLQAEEVYEVSYTVAISRKSAEEAVKKAACGVAKVAEMELAAPKQQIPEMEFQKVSVGGVSDVVFDRFVKSVFRQVEFCSRANYYAASYYMGIRDIFQQMEASLCWIPDDCRKKIVEAMDYIGEDGRAPRQYTYPEWPGKVPEMDLREFIDQGVWIISTIYTYLSYTGDYSILEEECGYYRFEGRKAYFSDQKDTVFDHMCRIMEYLLSNVDEETGCLHILFGDWNDALDGLGASLDHSAEYGTGVSVMATLQLYQNLWEMDAITTALGRNTEAERYRELAEKLAVQLEKNAIDTNEKGERKVIHGWGDQCSYKVGSWKDNDGKSRDGLTTGSYWILSGMLKRDESMKADILRTFANLDSKYGYKTFEPGFGMDNKLVGRIPILPIGTAENGAAYIHATMFAIWALFEMGEGKLAWNQLEKILPITHEKLTHSPFVMSNSYSHDEDKGIDGESMNDWFTGSACVFIKVLLWQVFGVQADLNGVTICPAKDLPFEKIQMKLNIKGGTLFISYQKGEGERKIIVNGQECDVKYNPLKMTLQIYLPNDFLKNQELHVEVLGGNS